MTPTEVQEKLKLNQLKDKIWYVVPSCATTGEGLFEGLVCIWHCGLFYVICADFNPGLALKQRQDASTKKQIESSSRTFDALLTTFAFFMIPLYIMLFFERADGLFCLLISVCCFCHQSERVPGGKRATAFPCLWHVPYRFVIACSLLSIIASYLVRAASATFIG